VESESAVCGVSILRSGEAFERALRQVCEDIRIGKALIQRDEETHQAKFIYCNYPKDIDQRYVLLMDPMLATGGSAIAAIENLATHDVPSKYIIFLTLIAAPEGLKKVREQFPDMPIVTTMVDAKLNENAWIIPGLGDFGDRYFGTEK
jgi:uracil phosphoribosyltransferase